MGLSSIDDVSSIISLLRYTDMSNMEIGSLFDVSDQTISDINNGRIWRRDELAYPIRNRKILRRHCKNCGKELHKHTQGDLCRECILKSPKHERYKKEIPISKDDLYKLLCSNTFVDVGKMFDVSDNTVRKWCDRYNISRHSSYYRSLAS